MDRERTAEYVAEEAAQLAREMDELADKIEASGGPSAPAATLREVAELTRSAGRESNAAAAHYLAASEEAKRNG